MKFPKLSYTKLLALILTGIQLSSCEKLLEIPPPVDQITKEQLFTDSATIASNMTGLYSSGFLSSELAVYPSLVFGLAGDEIALSNTGLIWNVFYQNNYTPVSSVGTMWSQPFAVIYHANGFIENLPESNAISERLKKQYIAEAKFMRAFQYIALTNYFGDVPLVLNTNIDENASLPRSPRTAVEEQIIKDLTEAIPDLTNTTDFTRATPYAACALIARIYLYQKKWDMAEEMASKAMEGPFELETDLQKTFIRTTRESILQASSKAGGGNYTNFTI